MLGLPYPLVVGLAVLTGALVASTDDYSESTLEIPYRPSTRCRIEGCDWFDRAGQQALYLPGQEFEVEADHFHGLLFNLNPQRLVQTIGREMLACQCSVCMLLIAQG